MTALQIASFGGALVGLGLTVLVGRLLPARVDPKWAIERLDPVRSTAPTATTSAQAVTGLQDRVGLFVQRRGPAGLLDRAPRTELALLQRPLHVYYGEKTLLLLLGLLFPPVATVMFTLLGIGFPLVIPAFASLGLAVLFWFAPDVRIRAEARDARSEFVRSLATYVDLVALERASGSGTTQSMVNAAADLDAWVFTRIHESLTQAELAGDAPWDALKDLGDELNVPELVDVGEIMRLSREEGATVYTQLRAKATSLRTSLINEDLAKANAAAEQQSVPIGLLLLVFFALLGAPALLRIVG